MLRFVDHGVWMFGNPSGWKAVYSSLEVSRGLKMGIETSKILWSLLRRCSPNFVRVLDLSRWGFSEAIDDVNECVRDEHRDRMILRVVLGDGIKNRWSENQYCASERDKGGPETFWPIRFYAINSYGTRCMSPMARCDFMRICSNVDGSVRLETSQEGRDAFMDDLDKWCVARPGEI